MDSVLQENILLRQKSVEWQYLNIFQRSFVLDFNFHSEIPGIAVISPKLAPARAHRGFLQ